VIAENPYASFERLVKEAPQSKSLPPWMTDNLIGLTMLRGHFDGLSSPEKSLPLATTVPVFFVHSKQDKTVSYKQSLDLAALYKGPKSVWLAEKGDHALISNADPAAYEKRVVDFLASTRLQRVEAGL
jgi:fermentation-respiration switch protein FrsA (DUF1100 family)